MPFSRTLVVQDATDVIANIWAMDPDCGYPCPEGHTFVGFDGPAQVGWIWNGNAAVPPPEKPATQAEADAAIQTLLDTKAQSWGYTDMGRAVGYVGDPNAQFDAEGTALRNWRSAVWVKAADIMAHVDPKNPPTLTQIMAQLPAAPARPKA